jgi:hypothetical protein
MLRKLDIARSWALAQAEHAAVVRERDQLRRELEWTKQSLREVHAAAAELKAATAARIAVERELADLYRERAIQRARAVERDPSTALN